MNLCSFRRSHCEVYKCHEQQGILHLPCVVPAVRLTCPQWFKDEDKEPNVPGETRQTGMTHTHGCYWHGQRRNISQPYQNIKHHIHHFPLKFFILRRGTLLGKHILQCRINSWPKRYLDSFRHLRQNVWMLLHRHKISNQVAFYNFY